MSDAEKKTILVVDDSAIDRMLLCNIFSGHFQLLEAADGKEALRLLLETPGIDLVITDLQMPVMDGYALLGAMAGDEKLRNIPVIAATANIDQAAQLKALDAGAIDIITKPYFAELILKRVGSLTGMLLHGKNADTLDHGELQKKILWQQEHDTLTGLYNKSGFYLNARVCLDEHPDTHYLLMRGDIDRFKAFNDAFGLPAGDKLLIAIGNKLHENQQKDNVFARLEADHFVALIPKTSFESEQYATRTANWLYAYPTSFHLACSIGIYDIDNPELEVAFMCDRALMALQTVKTGYMNKVAFYDDALRQRMFREQELTGEMADALEKDQFRIYFQPQVNYASGKLIGAEALVRWFHPGQGMILPGEFIPLFEKNGFISRLDEYVWEKSCQYMRKWYDQKGKLLPISVSVNISRVDLYDDTLCPRLLKLIDKYLLAPADLRLEITESAYMSDSSRLIEVVKLLRSHGFSVEMDDFGSGYSSLNMLKDVLVDMVKLDMRFLSAAENESRSGNILSSVIRMAHGIKMSVIAEGVETREQAEYLKSLGCLFMQGYYFARPMPAEEFEKLLNNYKIDLRSEKRFYTEVDGSADFLSARTQSTLLFNSFVGGAAILEYANGVVTALRLNDSFFKMLNITPEEYNPWRDRILDNISPDTRQAFIDMLENAERTGDETSCEAHNVLLTAAGEPIWLFNRARFLARKAEARIFYVSVENISEQKRLSRQLEAQNSSLQMLYSSMPCGIIQYSHTDGKRKIVRYNDAAWKLLGYTDTRQFEAVTQQQIGTNNIHPDDVLKIRECIERVDRTGEPEELDHRLLCVNGALRWVHTRIQNITYPDGNRIQQATFMDVTPLKQAEEQYAQESLRMQTILNAIPGGISVFKAEGKKVLRVYLSDKAYDILGNSKTDAPAIDFSETFERVHPDDRKKLRTEINGARNEKRIFNIDMRILPKDGGLRWVNLTAAPAMMEDGLYYFGVYSDISARKTGEETEKLSRLAKNALTERGAGGVLYSAWQELFEHTKDLLFIKDINLMYLGASKTFSDMVGVSDPRQIIGKTDFDLFTDRELAQRYTQDDLRLLQNGTPLENYIEPIPARDKNPRYSSTSKYAIHNADGEIIGLYGVGHETSELKIAEGFRAVLEQTGRMFCHYTVKDRVVHLAGTEWADARLSLSPGPEALVEDGSISPESAKSWIGIFDAVDRGKKSGSADIRFKNKEGKYRWYNVRFTGIADENGEPVSAIVSYEDITDRRESGKNRAMEWQGIFRALSEIYPMSISCNLTQNSYHTLESEYFIHHTASPEGIFDDLINDALSTIPDEYKAGFQTTFSRHNLASAFEDGKNMVRLEYRQFGDDGILHWMESSALRVDDPDGRDLIEIAFVRCIDEQKSNEEKLKVALEYSSGELEKRLRYGALVDRYAPSMVMVYHTNRSEKTYVIGNLLRNFGYSDTEITNLANAENIWPIIFHEDQSHVEKKAKAIISENLNSYELEYRILRKDGTLAWITAHGTKFTDSLGDGYICIYVDDTGLHALMDQLRTSSESYRIVVESSNRLVFRYSVSDGTAEVPVRARELFALPEVLHDLPESLIRCGFIREVSAEEYRAFCQDLRAGIPCRKEWSLCCKTADGHEVWIRLQYALIANESGETAQAIVYADDMTASKKREDHLVRRAEQDGLTGLYDRTTAEKRIREELQSTDHLCALLSIDMDNFKEINDLYGHAQGDHALSSIAKELTLHFRSTDIIGRFGGDEFTVFLPGFGDEKMLDHSLSLLLRRLSAITVGENNERSTHCSIGAAIGSKEDGFDVLYHRADIALYHVKRHNRNDYAFYEENMEKENYIFKSHASLSLRNTTVWDNAELRGLAGAVAAFYPLVISANISKNSLYLMESSRFINSTLPEFGTTDDFIKAAEKIIHPDDRERFVSRIKRSHLLSLYESGNSSLYFRCREIDNDGIYHWTTNIIVLYKNMEGDICGFAFTRPTSEEAKEQQPDRL